MVLDQTHILNISGILEQVCEIIHDHDRNYKKRKIDILLRNLRQITSKSTVVTTLLDENILYKVNRVFIARSSVGNLTTYAIDSGSTNPIPLANGTTIDICHAGVSVLPTNYEIERYRSIVSVIYTPDTDLAFPDYSWRSYDNGYARQRQIFLQNQKHSLQKHISRNVHNIAIHYSESEHLKWILDKAKPDKNTFIYLDGSVYPKQLMYWIVKPPEYLVLRQDPLTTTILQNYIDIIDYCIENKVPLVGFVKNPTDSQIIRSDLTKEIDFWTNDTQMFRTLLDNTDLKEYITYTGWFHQHKRIYGTSLDKASPLVGENITHKHQEINYEPVFFMVYIPVENIMFKVESVYGLIKDPSLRELILEKVLHDISINASVPPALQHVDFVAKISAKDKSSLKNIIPESMRLRTYDEKRFGELAEEEM